MKVLMINGSPRVGGNTSIALAEMEKIFAEEGIESETIQIGAQAIRGCIACGTCRKNGKCVFDDAVNQAAPKFEAADGLVVASPVYYASANGTLVSFLDRLFYASGGRLAGKPAAAVVSCRRGGAATAFDQLNKYFSISNMPIATSQYWNQNHGNNAAEAAQDTEGMQTMRTLGQNILWMLRSIEAGKRAGIPAPAYEAPAPMNFIH